MDRHGETDKEERHRPLIDRTDGQIVTDTVGETPMTDRQTDIDRQQMNRQK